jgi:hypothetical protein
VIHRDVHGASLARLGDQTSPARSTGTASAVASEVAARAARSS